MYAAPPHTFPSASTAVARITSEAEPVEITGLLTAKVIVFAALAKNVSVLAANVTVVVLMTIDAVPAVPSARWRRS